MIASLDTQVLAALFATRDPSVVVFMANISLFGEWTVLLPLSTLIACAMFIANRRSEAAGLMLSVWGGTAIVLALKLVVARPRPDVYFRAITETGYSFPSAHATLAVVFFGFLCYVFLCRTQSMRLRWFGCVLVAALALLIGFSRLYLGVHYLSDVVVGFAIGGLFLWLGILATKLIRNRAAS